PRALQALHADEGPESLADPEASVPDPAGRWHFAPRQWRSSFLDGTRLEICDGEGIWRGSTPSSGEREFAAWDRAIRTTAQNRCGLPARVPVRHDPRRCAAARLPLLASRSREWGPVSLPARADGSRATAAFAGVLAALR